MFKQNLIISRLGVSLSMSLIVFSSLASADPKEKVTPEQSQKALLEVVSKNNLHAIVGADKQNVSSNKHANKVRLLSNVREGRVIVRLSPSVTTQQFKNNLLSTRGGDEIDVVKSFPLRGPTNSINSGSSHIVVVQAAKKSTKEVMSLVKNLPGVELAEPDFIVTTSTTTPDDPSYGDLWGLNNTGQTGGTEDADIDAPEAWAKATGSDSVVVGVIDTGVDYNHPDLVDNMWKNPLEFNGTAGVDDDGNGYIDDIYGIDAINDDSDPMDDQGHGTHVAGTIGATGNNDEGVVGVNQKVAIAGCKFLSAFGSGSGSDAIECVNYFTGLKQDGVNVVVTNNSWGGGAFSQILKDSIDAAGSAGIVFAAAAGNGNYDNDASPSYPASYTSPSIIAVASTDHNDDRSSFSQWGLTSVDLAAPGTDILSTVPGTEAGGCAITPSNILWNERFTNLSDWSRFAYHTTTPPLENQPNLWWQSVSLPDSPTSTLGIDDSPNGDYENYVFSAITYDSTPIDLSSANGDVCLSMTIKGENEDFYDSLGVYITGDDGASWSLLGSIDKDVISDWEQHSFTVPDSYKTADFRLSLARSTDSIVTYDGYKIDEVVIGDNAVSNYTGNYDTFSGTSMATPHVAGAIALAASVVEESVAERKSRVLDNVDPIASMNGLVVSGGRLNVDKMIPLTATKDDFNGDGKADLVWRNKVTGSNSIWHMDDNIRVSYTSTTTVANPDFKIVGTDDFNGDGKVDLVWRNTATGANVIWHMDNGTKLSHAFAPSLTNTDWNIVGADDFNGDGKPDLVWRNTATGANVIWHMDNGTKLGHAFVPAVSNLDWKIVGTGDFNGDDKVDLVWRNTASGGNLIWHMDNDGTKLGHAFAPSVNLNWDIVGANDVNGDGKTDLILRNTANGANLIWYMDNNTKLGGASFTSVPSSNWEIVGN